MGSIPPELSLDFRPTYLPITIADFLKDVSVIENVSEKLSKLDRFVKGLEEEMKKIDAFKRELPLSMLLLNDAILYLKAESMQCVASKNQPVLEEFIPLKKNNGNGADDDDDYNEKHGSIGKEKDSKDKKNWMSSVQLWNTNDPISPSFDPKQNLKLETKAAKKENQFESEDTFQASKSPSAARPFMPFHTYPGLSKEEDSKNNINNIHREELPVAGLSLLTPGIKCLREDSNSTGSRISCSKAVSSSAPSPQPSFRNGPQPPHQQQTARKQRRCWSPELHRRFVSALQQLGGSQVATPKQIRELMQVKGLTNDEVKSHLQKYRLHTRRVPSAKNTTSAANQSIVLGGLWMSQDQYGDSKATSSQSGSPQGPLQLAGHTAGTSGGYSMEDDEDADAKSEGYSWKSHIHRSGKDDV